MTDLNHNAPVIEFDHVTIGFGGEPVLDDVSFEGPDLVEKQVVIDDAYVDRMLAEIVKSDDLSRYVL